MSILHKTTIYEQFALSDCHKETSNLWNFNNSNKKTLCILICLHCLGVSLVFLSIFHASAHPSYYFAPPSTSRTHYYIKYFACTIIVNLLFVNNISDFQNHYRTLGKTTFMLQLSYVNSICKFEIHLYVNKNKNLIITNVC